tara:strand:+ start:2803 stop:3402 length:600 start_codon:yes stop_codon:yes gene_type:complete
MTSPYIELSKTDARKILQVLSDQADTGLDTEKTRVLKQDLSFAPGWQRLTCEDYTVMPYRKMDFLRYEDSFYPLEYSGDPYEQNNFSRLPVIINSHTVIDYLKFYYDYYRPSRNKLKPVFHVDDIQWQEDLAPVSIKSLQKELATYPLIKEKNTGYEVISSCIFGHSIMEIRFIISPDGKMEIGDSRVLIDDLPVKTFP